MNKNIMGNTSKYIVSTFTCKLCGWSRVMVPKETREHIFTVHMEWCPKSTKNNKSETV